VTVVSIGEVKALRQRPGLRSASIDEPLTGTEVDTYGFEIKGKAATETEGVRFVEVRPSGCLVTEAPVAPASVEAAASATQATVDLRWARSRSAMTMSGLRRLGARAGVYGAIARGYGFARRA
jgi:hypothetical protein